MKNIFACLVHEQLDCVYDLVNNLHSLDPDSAIILYDGSTHQNLLDNHFIGDNRVFIHPKSQAMRWGWLHGFALDCMEYADSLGHFTTLTIVDSDQLCVQKNYSDRIHQSLERAEKKGLKVGMLVSNDQHQTVFSSIDPVITAYQEQSAWLSLLSDLPGGVSSFLYWTFWPSTVFTYDCCMALLSLFGNNEKLQNNLLTTKIWASEEILFPTLSKALGFDLLLNPCSFDYVKFRAEYSEAQIESAIDRENCYWVHPIARNIHDPHRQRISQIMLSTDSENYDLSWKPLKPLQPSQPFSQSQHSRGENYFPPESIAIKPNVTCIMPTANRRSFVPASIERFLCQDYELKELLVIDDGEDAVADLVPAHKNIRYVRLSEPLNIGDKRNYACELAIGEYILNWDDDDWYADNWISSQVALLTASRADVVGLSRPFFYCETLNRAWQYQYPTHEKKWVHGATLGFTRAFWQRNKFPSMPYGEDVHFLWSDTMKSIESNVFHEGYVGRIHPANTSPKYTADCRWKSIPVTQIKSLIAEHK